MTNSPDELPKHLRGLRQNAPLSPDEIGRGFKRMTQELLAEHLNWSGAAHVSEIENGQRLPTPETLSRWIDACGGSPTDLHHGMGLAGYIPPTRLPDKDKLLPILNDITDHVLISSPYPSYIIDYRNNIWASNGVSALFFENRIQLVDLMRRPLNLFHLLFDSTLPLHRTLTDLKTYQRRQIIYFKALNILRRHEHFFRHYPDAITRHLIPADARCFEQSWEDAQTIPDNLPLLIEPFTFRLPHIGKITFQLHDETIRNFPDILSVVYYRPDASITGNIERVQKAIAPWQNAAPIKLWELVDIQEIIDQYNTS